MLVFITETDVTQRRLETMLCSRHEQLTPLSISVRTEKQIIHATRERIVLQPHGKQAGKDGQQAPCRFCAVDLVHRMHKTVRRCTDLRLVQHTCQELAVAHNDNFLFFVLLAPVLGAHACLGIHVQALGMRRRHVQQNGRDHLLACPPRHGSKDGGRERTDATTKAVGLGSQCAKDELLVLVAGIQCILRRHPHTTDDMVLDETAQWIATRRHKVLIVRIGNVVAFSAGHLALREVHVHLVTVKVCIVRVAVRIVHADRPLTLQHTRTMRHHGRLVQRRLAIHHENIARAQVAQHLLVCHGRPQRATDAAKRAARLTRRLALRCQQLVCKRSALLDTQVLEQRLGAVFGSNSVCSRVHVRAVNHQLAHELVVVYRHWLGVCQSLRKHRRHTNLVRLDIHIGRND